MDFLLVPYTYVLNPLIRKRINLDIKDKIIVFDEAHNIESNAESCFNKELSFKHFRQTLNSLYLGKVKKQYT